MPWCVTFLLDQICYEYTCFCSILGICPVFYSLWGMQWHRVYRVLVGKLEGRRPLGRPRRRWVDNIRMDLQEVGCGFMDWIRLAQDRDRWQTLVNAVMNLWVP